MSRVVSLDLGTMFFHSAEKEGDELKFKTIRNCFVELHETDDIEETLKRNNWQYIEDDGKYYVIGDDAMKVANIFPGKVEVRRPMSDGVLNKNEDKKLVVLAEMIRSSIGEAPDDKSWCCICVSSESVDGSMDSVFHKNRIEAMVARLGWNVKVIEEGHAVVTAAKPVMYEEGGEVPYSGIGISLGGGRANCVLSYRGLQIIGMSVVNCGDYIDRKVSEQTGVPISQVISIKEKKLDFENLDFDDDVIFALDAYYEQMIRYVFGHFAKKFQKEKSNFESPMDIVVAGGTSMPNGFCKKLEKVIRGLDLPFNIKEVRHAENPRTTVVEGLYIQSQLAKKKADKAE